jgi:hypothetical protein
MTIPLTSYAGVVADLAPDRAGIASDPRFSAERRSKFRYPLYLSVRFHAISGLSAISGDGHTLNISRSGVLVHCQHVALDQIGAGARLDMSIEWPVLLRGKIPLQLFVQGIIVRVGASVFAARFERHQFRTRSVSSQPRFP